MKLKKIELDGFGKLVNRAFEFSPGLNLIYGNNEAGKSTLQRSILTALYGFFDDGPVTAAKKAAMASYAPWDDSASFGMKLVFEVKESVKYRVERTFGLKSETTLYDLKSGKNVNSRFHPASQGRLFFAEELLGMPREVFENTSLVRQAELAALENSASAITDTLLRLSASASKENTTSQALNILETALKEQIGTPRSRSKPLPEAQHQLDTLKDVRTSVQDEYRSLINLISELDRAEEDFEKLKQERVKEEYLHLTSQLLYSLQQQQIIDQADAEVSRCQNVSSQLQIWSKFPIESEAKILQFVARHENLKSAVNQAEKTALHSQKSISALAVQIFNLHKALNISSDLSEVPELKGKSGALAKGDMHEWFERQLLGLRQAVEEQKKTLASKSDYLKVLNQIGHEGIAQDRQELGKLKNELDQLNKTSDQALKAAIMAGLPEDQWEKKLSEAKTKVAKWQKWSNFPAHLREELIKLTAQYTPQHENLIEKQGLISNAENKLVDLNLQIDTLQRGIADLEKVRNTPQQEKSRIQEMVSRISIAKQSAAEAHQQFSVIDKIFQSENQAIEKERQLLEPLIRLGISGLNQFQQRWLNASQQLPSLKARFLQSEQSWTKVGMTVDDFQKLGNSVNEIQLGIRPTPNPRRGCRSFFRGSQTSVVDQTPTEVTIYSQIRPIYHEFVQNQNVYADCESRLHRVETELKQSLGQLAPDSINEDTFILLLEQFEKHQQKANQVNQQKETRDSRYSNYQQCGNNLSELQDRLEKDLNSYGFMKDDVEEGLVQFFNACEKKERLIALELDLDRLNSQYSNAKQKNEQYKEDQSSLKSIEGKIIGLLATADIRALPDSLQEDILRFEEGVGNNRNWREALNSLERTELEVDGFQKQINNSRSEIENNKGKLINFCKRLIQKYSGLLPDEFTDDHLGQLDSDLQSYNSALSETEKVEGKLEQIKLQTENIQRGIDDWAEKEESIKALEMEILRDIHNANIEIDKLSFDEALIQFKDAAQGFKDWSSAQGDYRAAVQAQQAVRSSQTQLESRISTLNEKIAEITIQNKEWKKLKCTETPEIYQGKMEKLAEQMMKEKGHLSDLKKSVDQRSKSLRPLAEIDEEIDLVNENIKKLTRLGLALDLAINELTTATHEFQKVFAPRLENIVDTGLEQITNGRYRKVQIDPNTLNVRVLAPERNELIETEYLSTGTRDLIYLVLRMGITQLMSDSGENQPLLLDDPFVEFDQIRQMAALNYLKNISEKTQVLLFSKDESIKNWFSENSLPKSQHKIIELG